MSFCSNCGKELTENEVCTCMGGASAQAQNVAPQPQQIYVQQPAYNLDALVEASPKYKPISMWGYFGYQLLFCINISTLVNFNLCVIFGFTLRKCQCIVLVTGFQHIRYRYCIFGCIELMFNAWASITT